MPASSAPPIGLDLGTTFSAVAYVDDAGRPRIIPNADGKTTTPSVVLIENGRCTVGDLAMNQFITRHEHVIRRVKRAIGDADYRFQNLSAVEISAEILKALKADAEAKLGAIGEAVITCPAYFNSIEIENTKRAGELAGLRVREIVKEPTAAAIYYGVDHMQDGETTLVCDLGGGTFDATVLRLERGVFTPLATSGDRELGGHDWTMDLDEMVSEQILQRTGFDPKSDLALSQRLYEDCEQAKRDFAQRSEVAITCSIQGRLETIVVLRDDFQARTEWRMSKVGDWCEEALKKVPTGSLGWRELSRILLVGGSSRLRRLGAMLKERSGIEPVLPADPDFMVALGAAMIAAGRVRPRKSVMTESARSVFIDLTDKIGRIAARNLGTRALDRSQPDQPRFFNAEIIPHGTATPVTRSREDLALSANGQRCIDIPVVEFEQPDGGFEKLDCYRFECRSGCRAGDRIRVTFQYDLSGIVSVEAIDVTSGFALKGERRTYEEPPISEVTGGAPRCVVFAIDNSGSMDIDSNLERAKTALVDTAKKLLANSRCQVGVVSFSTTADLVCELSTDLDAIRQRVQGMRTVGGTAMNLGIDLAASLLLKTPAGTELDLVLLTDGVPDEGCRNATLAAASAVRKMNITLSMLDISPGGVGSAFLQQLSPNYLKIDSGAAIGSGMTTLLTQAAAQRGHH